MKHRIRTRCFTAHACILPGKWHCGATERDVASCFSAVLSLLTPAMGANAGDALYVVFHSARFSGGCGSSRRLCHQLCDSLGRSWPRTRPPSPAESQCPTQVCRCQHLDCILLLAYDHGGPPARHLSMHDRCFAPGLARPCSGGEPV